MLRVPLYHQLKEVILEQIQTGQLKPAEQIPTEDELVRRYEVSKTTVRLALRELAIEGFLRREQGRGTFVAAPKIEQGPRELTSFTQDMRRRGLKPGSKVLDQEIIEAPEEVREKLHLQEGDQVLYLRRLRMADGEPMGIQTAYIPLTLCPGLEDERFEGQSLYHLLEEKFGLTPAFAREIHSAVALDKSEARLLKAPVGSPALAVERQTFLADERPIELTYSVMRGDKYNIVLHLKTGKLFV
jgi:GntR family transcriptional regulator